MGKIFYIMGKSSSGKDSIYRKLESTEEFGLKRLVIYTTRPIRDGEKEGREYYFTDENKLEEFRRTGKLIEARTYETVYGPWIYFTADDGQVSGGNDNYLGIGTLESYVKLREYYGDDVMCPVYIQVEDGERLERAPCQGKDPGESEIRGDVQAFSGRPEGFFRRKYSESRYRQAFLES